MSKQCAICGQKINFVNEEKLDKDYSDVKICFSCYEYVATAHKGNVRAITYLKSSYKDDISPKVKNYIDTLETKLKFKTNRKDANETDTFMDSMNGKTSDSQKIMRNSSLNVAQFVDPKLSKSKINKLTMLYSFSNVSFGVVMFGGSLLSFYIYIQTQNLMFGIFSFIVTIGFSIILYLIKSVVKIFINK